MYQFHYRVLVATGNGCRSIPGTAELNEGENRILIDLPAGHLISVSGTLRLSLQDRERFFMNGFQTWTFSPEYGRNDRMVLCRAPKFLEKKLGLDHYGDDYFARPVSKPGTAHGESWCYFRRGVQYRLFASLDETPGYTIFRYDAGKSELRIERDCEGVNCHGSFHAFDLFLGFGNEKEVFDAWFGAMGVSPRTTERAAGYSSWYNRYQSIDSASIATDLAGCVGVLEEGDVFQIDDGWEPFVGDWLCADKKKFPLGMKPAADAIHANGFKAGLWLAPFLAEKKSALYKEHPDWFIRTDGEPWYAGCNWSGSYALDFDKPLCRAYLREVFRTVFDDWGYDLVKLDFLYAAAPLNTSHESRAARMIRALRFLRECCGDKLILGCGVPLMPAFGLVDYCRISCDVSLDWDDKLYMQIIHRERVSTRQALYNTVLRRQLNGRAFLNDPDVFFLRESNLKLTPEQKDTLASLNALFGGVFFTSDNMSDYTPEMKKRYRYYRNLRDAEHISVYTDRGVTVTCESGGTRTFHFE